MDANGSLADVPPAYRRPGLHVGTSAVQSGGFPGTAGGIGLERNVREMVLDRITRNPEVMGGKPCLRGMRVTVGTIVGLVASGHPNVEILTAYPYLDEEDIRQALAYAAWRVEWWCVPFTPVARN